MNSSATSEIESEECPEATDGQQKEGRTESELKRSIKRAVRMQREAQKERERNENEAEFKRRCEAAAREAKARELRKLDLNQAHNLMEGLSRAIEDVGGDSYEAPLPSARWNPPRDCTERRWRLGNASIKLVVFPMERNLDGHAPDVVSFAGMLRDENGYGLNYVLARHGEDDASGKWYVKPEYPRTSAQRQVEASTHTAESRPCQGVDMRWEALFWRGPWETLEEVGGQLLLSFLSESVERAGRKW